MIAIRLNRLTPSLNWIVNIEMINTPDKQNVSNHKI